MPSWSIRPYKRRTYSRDRKVKIWIFRNEPGTGYYCCTKQPSPIYGDDMRRIVYTDYGTLLGCIPTLTFDALFPALKFAGGGYRFIDIADNTEYEGVGTYIIQEIER